MDRILDLIRIWILKLSVYMIWFSIGFWNEIVGLDLDLSNINPFNSGASSAGVAIIEKCSATAKQVRDERSQENLISMCSVAIGNPERHMCKVSHCGSKQQ